MLQLRTGDKVSSTDVFSRQPGGMLPSQTDIDREVELLLAQFGRNNASLIPYSTETLPTQNGGEKFRIWIIALKRTSSGLTSQKSAIFGTFLFLANLLLVQVFERKKGSRLGNLKFPTLSNATKISSIFKSKFSKF